ncbi:cytochrome b-245 chaperone 1 isoform X2 [Callorhinus ursinus]|uniref:cytochrome b-245 chaperone 1 isoform X2 n=1 Tax=Callorhinus ursinus TaxID=34884 RepID=UPI003CD04E6C
MLAPVSCREWCALSPGMYMRVESRTSSCLHLKRAPGIRSWSLLVGILSIGLAAAYYSGDSLGWKLFYVTGCLFVAVQNLEAWEEAVFNKSTGQVVLKTFSLYRKLLTLFRTGHDQGGSHSGLRGWAQGEDLEERGLPLLPGECWESPQGQRAGLGSGEVGARTEGTMSWRGTLGVPEVGGPAGEWCGQQAPLPR